jgi:TfoX/Sxy family transcriptional regulator of competence genes
MECDEGLAQRVRELMADEQGMSEKRMFGGVAFLVNGNMSVGVVGDNLMVRVGTDAYESLVRERHARKMHFTGKPMKGFVYVAPEGLDSDVDLSRWVDHGPAYARSPPHKPR